MGEPQEDRGKTRKERTGLKEKGLITGEKREKAWSWEKQSKSSRTQAKEMGVGEVWKYFLNTDLTHSRRVCTNDEVWVQLHLHLNTSQPAKAFLPHLGWQLLPSNGSPIACQVPQSLFLPPQLLPVPLAPLHWLWCLPSPELSQSRTNPTKQIVFHQLSVLLSNTLNSKENTRDDIWRHFPTEALKGV